MNKKNPFEAFHIPVIGVVHSCYKEKFAVPRQSGLAPIARAELEILPPYNVADAFMGLESSSHIWLQFIFHQNRHHSWRPKVRPPRLGGNDFMGVFATRSPVRPSALGLSAVKLDHIDYQTGVVLHIRGADLVDGTPVVDIKPYVPYADCLTDAINTFAAAPPSPLPVVYCSALEKKLERYSDKEYLKALINQVLKQDPRPQYHNGDIKRVYGAKIDNYDLRWRYIEREQGEAVEVIDLVEITSGEPPLP